MEIERVIQNVAQLSVEDIMQKDPIKVKVTDSIDEAAGLLADYNIRHLPVVDDNGDIQGVISDRDLLSAVLRLSPTKIREHVENTWNKNQVSTVMTKIPETIEPETTLAEAGMILFENKISCLPVVEGNRLIGIITDSDFVKLVSQGLQK